MDHSGLKAVSQLFGYTITWYVGTLTRIQGDEYEMNAKRITSLGASSHEDILANGTSDLSKKRVRKLHRLSMLEIQDLDPKVWEPLLK